MNILNEIDICLVGLKHRTKIKYAMMLTNSILNIVLRISNYQDWDHPMSSGNLFLYNKIIYKWEDRHYVKIPCSWGPGTHFIKHKHG